MLSLLLPTVNQRRRVPLAFTEVEFSIGLVPFLAAFEESPCLGFLARLHSFWYDVGDSALAYHLQDVLTVKLPIHQHVVDVDKVLRRVQEVLDDLLA